MLVRSFEIQGRARAFAIARLDHKGMGRAGVEPHVKDVVDRLEIREVGEKSIDEQTLHT